MNRETALGKIEHCLDKVEAMLRGDKPADVPPALQEILIRMYADFLLPETPLSYYTADDETLTADLAVAKGDTRIHPISAELYNCHDHIARNAHKNGYYNWKVFGMTDRDISKHPLALAHDADALILTRSDLHGLRQALHVLKAKLENNPTVQNTQLIIQSSQNDFWGPLLKYFNYDPAMRQSLEDMGIHITFYPGDDISDTAESTLSVLATHVPNISKRAAVDRAPVQFEDDTELKVASTATHKPREIQGIFESFDVSMDVEALFSLMEKPLIAKETAKTCIGNNNEKREALQKKIKAIGIERLYAHLRKQGKDPEKAIILFDDRGLSFPDKRITDAPVFDDVRHHMNAYSGKENPGAELSNLMNHLSWAELQARVKKACEQVFKQTRERPVPEIRDTATYMAVKLSDMLLDNPPMITAFGVTRSLLDLKPQMDRFGNMEVVTISDQISRPLALGGTRTKQEICNYLALHSEVMLALRALARTAGVKNLEIIRENALSRKFNASATQTKIRIASFYSLIKEAHGHGIDHLFRRLPHNTYMMSGRDGRYDPTKIRPPIHVDPVTERCNETHEHLANKSLARMRRLITEADAIFYGPVDPKLLKRPGLKWLKELFFSGPYVGTQVSDPTVQPVFKGFYSPDFKGTYPQVAGVSEQQAANDPTWGSNWRDLFHRMKTPLSKNKVDSIFDVLTGNLGDFSRALVKHSQNYSKRTPEDHRFIEEGTKAPSDLYRVTFYSSASLAKTTPLWSDVKNLTHEVARNGFAVISGGGEEGLMNATAEGVHEYREIHEGETLPRHHISSIQCQDTFQMEGLDRRADYVCICNTREERMAKLMNCDAEVLLPGGEGSKEEKAASFFMRSQRYTPTRSRPFIIVNQEINGIRPFDELIADITMLEREALNIHIVNHTTEVLPLLQAQRQSLRARLGEDAIYDPTPVPQIKAVYTHGQPRVTIA